MLIHVFEDLLCGLNYCYVHLLQPIVCPAFLYTRAA